MASPADLDLEMQERARLLAAWEEKRRQIAVLEAATITWTSPLGRTYTDPPHPRTVTFM